MWVLDYLGNGDFYKWEEIIENGHLMIDNIQLLQNKLNLVTCTWLSFKYIYDLWGRSMGQ